MNLHLKDNMLDIVHGVLDPEKKTSKITLIQIDYYIEHNGSNVSSS